MPSSTPAGTLTEMVRRARTRPSPAHSGQGSGMTWPVPRAGRAGRGWTRPGRGSRAARSAPRRGREQVVAGGGCVPGAVPAPVQTVHRTAVSTVMSLVTPKTRLVELELDRDERVAAGAGAAARPAGRRAAEERVHDVAEPAEAGAAEAAGPAAAAGVERVAAEVDDAALLRVGQRLVGAGDLLEALLGRRVGVDVGVQVAGHLPVGALDLAVTGIAGHAQHAEVVGRHRDCPSASALGQQVADVAGHGANRGHVPWVVHAGGADDAEPAERAVAPRAVADGDERGAGERLVGVLLTDPHQHRARVHLSHQPQDHDLFFQRLQQRPHVPGKSSALPRGEVRRAADDQPVLAGLDQRLQQRGADRGDQRRAGAAARSRRRSGTLSPASASLTPPNAELSSVRSSATASASTSTGQSTTRCSTRPVSVISTSISRAAATCDHLEVADGAARQRRVLDDGDLAGQLGEQPHGAAEDVVQVDRAVEELARSPGARPPTAA